LIKDGKSNEWWEQILYTFAESGEEPIETIEVGDYFWREIDFIDEYQEILDYVRLKKGK